MNLDIIRELFVYYLPRAMTGIGGRVCNEWFYCLREGNYYVDTIDDPNHWNNLVDIALHEIEIDSANVSFMQYLMTRKTPIWNVISISRIRAIADMLADSQTLLYTYYKNYSNEGIANNYDNGSNIKPPDPKNILMHAAALHGNVDMYAFMKKKGGTVYGAIYAEGIENIENPAILELGKKWKNEDETKRLITSPLFTSAYTSSGCYGSWCPPASVSLKKPLCKIR